MTSCSPCVIWTRSYRFVIASWKTKEENSATVKYWEMIADKLSKAVGLGAVSHPWLP